MKKAGCLIRNSGRKEGDIMANEFISGSLFCFRIAPKSANPKFLSICRDTAAMK